MFLIFHLSLSYGCGFIHLNNAIASLLLLLLRYIIIFYPLHDVTTAYVNNFVHEIPCHAVGKSPEYEFPVNSWFLPINIASLLLLLPRYVISFSIFLHDAVTVSRILVNLFNVSNFGSRYHLLSRWTNSYIRCYLSIFDSCSKCSASHNISGWLKYINLYVFWMMYLSCFWLIIVFFLLFGCTMGHLYFKLVGI